MSSDMSATTATQSSDTKECPFCAETIKAKAVMCRYCGRDVPGAAVSGPAVIVSVVPGPTGLTTANTTSAPVMVTAGQVLDLLTHLVDKNLVAYEEDEEGQGRYRCWRPCASTPATGWRKAAALVARTRPGECSSGIWITFSRSRRTPNQGYTGPSRYPG
jgi:hypothetical protein